MLAQVTKEHNEECKRLLRLMGVPVVDAASEAEAQCAVMAKVRERGVHHFNCTHGGYVNVLEKNEVGVQ
jgi:hypothetical protein